MRLKEIKPGMVIHCKNHEEKKTLLEEAERIGYLWANGDSPTKSFFPSNTLVFREDGLRKNISWTGDGDKNTEFSDLILPELTAEEVLEICHEMCKGKFCNECLMNVNCFAKPESDFKKVVEICEQWKSGHEKKEPEIETVDICRIIEVLPDGRKRCVHEEDIKPDTCRAEILKQYCMEHEGEFIAVNEVVSRVKR